MIEPREYSTEGHRLLLVSAYSPSEIAKLSGIARQRVSEWRGGSKRPDAASREALERAIGIPSRAWEAPPVVRPPAPRPADITPGRPAEGMGLPSPQTSTADAPAPDLDGVDLDALGLDGLERLAAKLEVMGPTLPPRERLRAVESQARIVAVHEGLRQKLTDARADYLAGPEFMADMRLLAAALPAGANALRAALRRLGVNLPAPMVTVGPQGEPPETAEELLAELRVADAFRKAGETALARGHIAGLAIDVGADRIAAMLLERPDVSPAIFALLDPADEAIIRSACERQMAIADAKKLPAEARTVVASLVRYLGHETVAAQLGAPE